MRVLVVLAHPDPGSFNHAIAGRARATLQSLGHMVAFHDLYTEGFDPVLPAAEIPPNAHVPPPVAGHIADLVAADGIVIVHPNWWGQPPAIITGWVDRVVRPRVAYRFYEGDSGEGVPVGLLRARNAVVFNTSNTKPEREKAHFGDPLEVIWKTCIFDLCGVPRFFRRTFSVVVTSSLPERQGWLDEVESIVRREFPAG
jgi:NAD(P)H dehydrogenase (quinone)